MAGSFIRTALVAAAAVGGAAATPRNEERQQEPCAQIANIFSRNSDQLSVPADTALACLKSVPLDTRGNVRQIEGLKSLAGFQSDLSYLIKPPPGYMYPAVDVMGGLDRLEDNLNNNFYDNEYDFQLDLYKVFAAAYDGHLSYTPDILGIFIWVRLLSEQVVQGLPQFYQLISVSSDGTSLPQVYSNQDVDALAGNAGYTPSPISQINGEDAETWLNTYAATNGNGRQQDPDANYNSLFPSLATDAVPALFGSYGNVFSLSGTYQGTDTVIQYANGTTDHILTEAFVSSDYREAFARYVTDGQSFFQVFCSRDIIRELTGGASSSGAPTPASSSLGSFFSSSPAKRAEITPRAAAPQASSVPFGIFSSIPYSSQGLSAAPSGSSAIPSSQVAYKPVPTGTMKGYSPLFPDPFIASGDFSVAGYLPENEDDLAVLAIPSYEPTSESQFSNVVRQFLATANSNGKSKLIIDLRGNPGGIALLATDTFKQLFPNQDPYGAGNYRANALFDFTGQSLSDYYEGKSLQQTENAGTDDFYAGTPFNVENEVTKAAKDFSSWADFFGPEYYHGDNYTELTRWNLSDPDQRLGQYIYGYGMNDKPQPQTFQSQNIVLLQDGACASTCTLFAELMKDQASVRSIVVGGRAQSGPMQAVGGVKGANVLSMIGIWQLIGFAYQAASSSLQTTFVQTFGQSVIDDALHALNRAAPSTSNVAQATFNFRNNFREGDSTNTPLQFVYEAADWRFFYTAEMYADQSLVWARAYDIVWGSGDAVADSTGEASAGFGTGYVLDSAPAGKKVDDTIFPSANLGKAVKPSATQAFGAKPTGNAAGAVRVSAGVVVGGLVVAAGLAVM